MDVNFLISDVLCLFFSNLLFRRCGYGLSYPQLHIFFSLNVFLFKVKLVSNILILHAKIEALYLILQFQYVSDLYSNANFLLFRCLHCDLNSNKSKECTAR